MKKWSLILFLIGYSQLNFAQTTYTLQQCIQYAIAHNITLQQNELSIKNTAITTLQNKYSLYPTVNADVSNGFSFGRSIDPTSNSFINQGYYYNGFGIGANMLLFGWFGKKYQYQASQLDLAAAKEQYKQLQNDIALNIATGYLRILLAKEQVNINIAQLKTDEDQLSFTQKKVNAGALPPLNAAQLQTQVAADSANLVNSQLDVNAALLDLKAFLNMDMNTTFDITTPSLPVENLLLLNTYPTAQQIFEVAKSKRPAIEANKFKQQSAEKQLQVAQAAKYPQVTIGANLGSNYASTVKKITGLTYAGEEPIGNVKFGDSLIPITRPNYNYTTAIVPLFSQYGNNIRQTVNTGISIPIFNGYANKLSIERAKLNIEATTLAQTAEINTLQQNVFKAYNDAQSGVQKLQAAKSNVQAAQLALDYAIKRYNAGLLATQEYTSQQNTLNRAKINELLSKYDYIFKLKILDFYLGKEISL